MQYIKIFIIIQLIFLALQMYRGTSLEPYQYSELIFGSFFIIVFFGIFGMILTLDYLNPSPSVLNDSGLLASLFIVWYYLTKKLTNYINSDSNGVIYY
jgi:hypothetical protein